MLVVKVSDIVILILKQQGKNSKSDNLLLLFFLNIERKIQIM